LNFYFVFYLNSFYENRDDGEHTSYNDIVTFYF
jgi:hypothetical protein